MPLHRPLFLLPPESAHALALYALETLAARSRLCALVHKRVAWTSAALETTTEKPVWSREFPATSVMLIVYAYVPADSTAVAVSDAVRRL